MKDYRHSEYLKAGIRIQLGIDPKDTSRDDEVIKEIDRRLSLFGKD